MKKSNRKSTGLERFVKALILILPAVLFFSYYPVMSFGTDETMNFELSLPMIWLVIFDAVAVMAMLRNKTFLKGLKGKWVWLLLPIWLTLSVLWSKNMTRGILTVGGLWLIYLAGYAMWNLRELYDEEFKRKWWRWFTSATVLLCAWCFLQCILDVCGVAREHTLMCSGCVYQIFGFPHPNGLAAEPQFMGNLLLAPIIVAGGILIATGRKSILWGRGPRARLHGARPLAVSVATSEAPQKILLAVIFAIIVSTLFLTMSRGAIFAFGVAMVVMSVLYLWKSRKLWKRLVMVWGMIVVSFLFTLNWQGLMAEVSPTDDTYFSGVSKVVNQLTLGAVDLGGRNVKKEISIEETESRQANFDGYVEISTEARLSATDTAVKAWSKDFKTALFGTGLGSASKVLYEEGVFETPKEIVNNEYISLLLETGLVGIGFLVCTLVLVIRSLKKSEAKIMMLSLIVAYLISLLFFSGLANALHIYLLPVIIGILTFKRLDFCERN